VLSFTGTVTDVGSVNVSPPEGVGIGAAVSGTVTYEPCRASMIEVGPSERAYVFLPDRNEITVEIGTHVWKTDLQTVVSATRSAKATTSTTPGSRAPR